MTRTVFAAMVLSLSLLAEAQDAPDPCSLIRPAEIAAAKAGFQGKLSSEGSSTIDRTMVPGLPVPLRVAECNSSATKANAITFRLGLLSASKPLSAQDWTAVKKALDDGSKNNSADDSVETRIGAASCFTHSWQGGSKDKPQRIHEVACSAIKGRHRVTVNFEDEDRNRLPDLKAVKAVLDAALGRVP
jgi:hypothetical protein